MTNCTGARVRNNVFWNDGVEPGLTWTGTAPDSDYNLYYPADISPADTNSVCVAPGIHSTEYYVLGSASAAFTNKGVVESAFRADAQGWYRHLSFPCRGAFEYQIIENSGVDAMGRVTGRTIAGRPHTLSYDAQGRLTSYTDPDGNSVTYEYDHLGRRVLTTHSSPLTTHQTRMVYDGTDVVADIVDEDGDGTVDRRRLYWILPQIDQRVGFVDIVGGQVKAYYYVTDQVGSVLQVLDENGAVVNQYNYDAWGNLLADGTFENVENRYRFQGREWDERLQAYYFRYRLYFPETGTFSGPDMDLAFDAYGPGSYAFAENDPLSLVDPMGLWGIKIGGLFVGRGGPSLVFNKEVAKAAGGGLSVTTSTLTFGATDYLGATRSDKYQGRAYTGTRILSTAGRELLVTAATLGTAQVARAGTYGAIEGTSWSVRAINAAAQSSKITKGARVLATAQVVTDVATGGHSVGKGVDRLLQGDRWGALDVAAGMVRAGGGILGAKELGIPKLSGGVKETFEGGQYTRRYLKEDMLVYRGEGQPYGRWYGIRKPDSAANAERLYNVVDHGSDLTEVSTYRMPKGTGIYEGPVAGGAGTQIYIPLPRRVGVKLVDTEFLPQSGF